MPAGARRYRIPALSQATSGWPAKPLRSAAAGWCSGQRQVSRRSRQSDGGFAAHAKGSGIVARWYGAIAPGGSTESLCLAPEPSDWSPGNVPSWQMLDPAVAFAGPAGDVNAATRNSTPAAAGWRFATCCETAEPVTDFAN